MVRILVEGIIDRRPNLRIERTILHIVHYPDNFDDRFGRKDNVTDLLADGIFTGKVFPRQGLINDGHERLRSILGIGEVAAAHELGVQRREKGRTHIPLVHIVVFPVVGVADNPDPSGVAVETDG